jgi:hypothetical protein
MVDLDFALGENADSIRKTAISPNVRRMLIGREIVGA